MTAEQHRKYLAELDRRSEELDRDLAVIDAERRTLEVVRQHHQSLANVGEKADTSPAAPVMLHVPTNGHANGAAPADGNLYTAMTAVPAVVDILTRAGSPLTTPVIAERLLAGGYQTKNPGGMRNSIFSTLGKRKDVFASVGKGLWTLANPPGSAVPADSAPTT